LLNPGTVILELSDPILQRDVVDSEFQLKGAEADYANLKVQVDSDLMNQKANEAAVRSDYEQARLQHDVDEKLYKEGIGSDHTRNLSKVKEDQLAIRLSLRAKEPQWPRIRESTTCRAAGKIDEQKALYQLKRAKRMLSCSRWHQWRFAALACRRGGKRGRGDESRARRRPRRLKAEIKIAETQAKDVAYGQHATIDTRNGVVKGHVIRIDPSVVNGTVTVDVGIDDPLPLGARPTQR